MRIRAHLCVCYAKAANLVSNCAHLNVFICTLGVASLPDLFNVHEKRGGAWDPMSRDKRRHNVMKDGLSTTVDFELVYQLQLIKHRSLRPSRILLHSLEGFGTISSIHIELERLTI